MPESHGAVPRSRRCAPGIVVVLSGLLCAGAARAELLDRGNGLIYDTVQNITWLQDANYAATSGYAAANARDSGTGATDNILLNGQMGWDAAVAWAEQLVYAGFDGWRLPTVLQPDPTCAMQGPPLGGFGLGCTGSEMGHLFNVDGIFSSTPGPFINVAVPGGPWWSGTLVAGSNTFAYWNGFNFGQGNQDAIFTFSELQAWAVHDGDIGAAAGPPARVPTPAWALAALLAGLLGARRRAARGAR